MHRVSQLRRAKWLAFSIIGVAAVLAVVPPAVRAQSNLIESVTEDVAQARGRETGDGCSSGQSNTNVTSPVRAGQRAFRHFVDNCGERAELAMSRTQIGQTYWQGWSLYLPSNFNPSGHFTIVAQWAAYPPKSGRSFPCGGVGHKMSISSGGNLEYDLQHSGGSVDTVCDEFPIGSINDMKGKWVDFVQHAKWTGNTDGFVKLWMKIGNNSYVQVINYTGRTWWNDEGDGPYFKMGAYMGNPNWTGSDVVLYTDEYRLGNANASFNEVAPPGSTGPAIPAAPTNLSATAGDGQVTLTWNGSVGAASYNVKQSTTSGGPYTTIATGVTATTYGHSVANGATTYYVVTAVSSAGESAPSNQASATPRASVVYQAEQATLSGPEVQTFHAGYTGTGYVDYRNDSGDFIEWTVTVPAAGVYTLEFRYANGSTSSRALAIRVGGTTVNSGLAFPGTGSWSTWRTASITATLAAGTNRVRATVTGANGANIDALTVR